MIVDIVHDLIVLACSAVSMEIDRNSADGLNKALPKLLLLLLLYDDDDRRLETLDRIVDRRLYQRHG